MVGPRPDQVVPHLPVLDPAIQDKPGAALDHHHLHHLLPHLVPVTPGNPHLEVLEANLNPDPLAQILEAFLDPRHPANHQVLEEEVLHNQDLLGPLEVLAHKLEMLVEEDFPNQDLLGLLEVLAPTLEMWEEEVSLNQDL